MNWSESLGAFSAILVALMPAMNQSTPSNMTPCTPSVEPAITVTVSDAQTGVPLEATVIVKDGNFQEELTLRGVTPKGQIIYGGAFERPGVYRIQTSTDGYETSVVTGIQVTKGGCHVVTRQLEVALNPFCPAKGSRGRGDH